MTRHHDYHRDIERQRRERMERATTEFLCLLIGAGVVAVFLYGLEDLRLWLGGG